MKHKIIWNAIERLAKDNNLSCSGLAKLSGLDATTFNKSKQFFSRRQSTLAIMQHNIQDNRRDEYQC